jgi:hypothetical protein
MKPSGLVVLAIVLCCAAAQAKDATTPIDYSQRNAPFAAAAEVVLQKQTPTVNAAIQEQRVEVNAIPKQAAAVGERRSAIEVTEAREKSVREKNSQRPEKREQPTSAFSQRKAAISTGVDTAKPPMVAKYQDSLTAASATNMARYPALHATTKTKVNRFVFQKNPPESTVVTTGAAVSPAAGGSSVQKK